MVLVTVLIIGVGAVIAATLYKVQSAGVTVSIGPEFTTGQAEWALDNSGWTACTSINSTSWTCGTPNRTLTAGDNYTVAFQVTNNGGGALPAIESSMSGGYTALQFGLWMKNSAGTLYQSPQDMPMGSSWTVYTFFTVPTGAPAQSNVQVTMGVYESPYP